MAVFTSAVDASSIWLSRTVASEPRLALNCNGNPKRSSQTLPRSGFAGQSPASPTRSMGTQSAKPGFAYAVDGNTVG